MSLQQQVQTAFGNDGCLARNVVEFRPRAGQLVMAQAIAQTMTTGGTLVVEAGTGIGKTYAYLVPALLSGTRVLVSTATKALQDQLYLHDIPRLMQALGVPSRNAVLKGRSSYLCLHRMHDAMENESLAEHGLLTELQKIHAWSHHTLSGDLSEVLDANDKVSISSVVSSTRDNCLGAVCAYASQCHVNVARKRAMEADVVVINHHLFFADLNIRESGVAELLPEVGAVVFDEAHQLNDIGVQFLGTQLSTHQLLVMCRDVKKQGSTLALGLSQGSSLLPRIEEISEDLRKSIPRHFVQKRLHWPGLVPLGADERAWTQSMSALRALLAELHSALLLLAPQSVEWMNLCQRVAHMLALVDGFAAPAEPGLVRWLEVGEQLRFFQSPIDIAQDMQTRVLNNAKAPSAPPKSWIFTSATLGQDHTLSWFVESCGVQGGQVLQVESPFDHATQSALYIPPDFPEPSDPSHPLHVAALVADAASVLGGRTMVLTTTLRAMHVLGQALETHFAMFSEIEVLVQGSRPKQELLQRFMEASGSPKGCVLIGAATFWEGIDLPGDALQLLVIDKLPFAPPDDPLMDARVKRAVQAGKSAFRHVHLPLASVALKQGAGRLIRRESDRGILVVCDVRMRKKGYGRQLISALPPMRKVETPEAFIAELNALTRLSTTDPHRP